MKRITPAAFYHIALAIGNSHDLRTSSIEFLKELVEQTNSKYACFYIYSKYMRKGEQDSTSLILISSYPEKTDNIQLDAKNTLIPAIGSNQAFYVFQYNSEEISTLPDYYPEDKDDHIIIPVKELGFIQLVTKNVKKSLLQKRESVFENEDSEHLSLLMSKFGRSIVPFLAIAGTNRTSNFDDLIHDFNEKSNIDDNDFLKRLLATISHEIRNPFNLLLGYTALLKETSLDDTQRNYINVIGSSSVSLYDVINKSLQFTNIYFKQLNINYQLFDIHSLIEDITKRYTFEADKKSLKFKLTTSISEELRIIGDKARLNDILSYLLSNAVKFTERGEIKLEITIKLLPESECQLYFSIADTGKGFDVSTVERILRYFGQEDNSISRNYGGLGLGLSISKYLIHKMGGKLTINSAPGLGSTFMFDLKFKIENQATTPYLLNLTNLKPELTSKINILLVDDDPYQRDMGKEILKEWNLTFAENGLEAVTLLKQGAQFDLILMDIRMPVMDGITATKIIRQELKSKIVIIALSGEAIRGSIEESEKAGMNAFVSKPYDKEKLIYSIISNLQTPLLTDIIPPASKKTGIKNMQGLFVVNKDSPLVITHSLVNSDCKFDIVDNLSEASELVDVKFYDFILLDVDLIETNIEMITKNAETVLIAYSTDDSDLTRQMCVDLNIDGLLIKEAAPAINFQTDIREIIDYRPLKQKNTIITTDRLYDISLLQNLIGKDEAGLKELIHFYLDHMPAYINQIKTALQNHDYNQLSRVAHSLKSTVKQYKIKNIVENLEKLEYMDQGKINHNEVENLVSEITSVLEISVQQLTEDFQ